MALQSPGIETKETSVQSTVVRNSTGRAAIVGKFSWGPAYQIRQISNEVELVNYFGSPDNLTADYFMSAVNFLQYGNDLRVVRVVDKDAAKNASAIFNQIKTTIASQGSNYTKGDVIKVKYNSVVVEENGKVSKVDSNGKILAVIIPSEKIVARAKQIGTYPDISTGWTTEIVSQSSGVSASIAIDGIESDSGITLLNLDIAKETIQGTAFQTLTQKYQIPSVVALYPGELGSTVRVEIISKAAYDSGAMISGFPSGVSVKNSGRSVMTYGPQTENQYAFIVRRGGIVQESFIVSTEKTDKDIYGVNIFMDDFFANGGSQYVYGTSLNWPKGFSGILEFGGGLSSNDTVGADELMNGWDMFADREALHVPLLIAGACAGETVEIMSTVQKHVISIGDERQDCTVFVSPPRSLLVNIPLATAVDNMIEWRTGYKLSGGAVVDNNLNVSSSYGFMDGNYKYQYDKYNDVNRWVPLAGDIAGLCVYTDSVAQPWMSPAGYNRGQIRNCIKLAIEPRTAHRDAMYQVQINPVTGFAGGSGFVLFGDKTLTNVPSPFDRINVRRLFNMIKKDIGDNAKYKLFENNDDFTRSSFRMDTGQYMTNIRALGGCYDYRVICDTTNNTPGVIDRNEFVATIYVKPPRSINYITLNFVATSTGADFDELVGPQAV
ncbi:putative tail sheath protein [Cronobacter phage vB_CsaM_SemperBestia]|uniref:Putative tail sheath protein n=1 Tax=Cronobacter phage vB_CsaM_SemperBestia TaxID=2777353 RepID=A0A7T3NBC8_9CAUD|nr:putative tail sheath protein [Cronobacter phage vB_CsaM_SemperBestia]